MSSTFNPEPLAQFTTAQEALDYVDSQGVTTDEVVAILRRNAEEHILYLNYEIEELEDDDTHDPEVKAEVLADLNKEMEMVRGADSQLQHAEALPTGIEQMEMIMSILETRPRSRRGMVNDVKEAVAEKVSSFF